jgi:hypothetical protein
MPLGFCAAGCIERLGAQYRPTEDREHECTSQKNAAHLNQGSGIDHGCGLLPFHRLNWMQQLSL